MLTIYRRHRVKCAQADDRISKKCRCSLWATGTLLGQPYRKSLKTRSWERAEQIARMIENGRQEPDKADGITVKAALDSFIAECESRNLNASTIGKYKRLARTLSAYADSSLLIHLTQLDSERIRAFRAGWKLAPRTASKQLERLRAVFRFFQENDWITKNPAKAIKAPQVKTLPRLPFTEKEVANILAKAKDDRELAFVLTLRHTGLRIGDASLLKTSHLSETVPFSGFVADVSRPASL